MDRDEEEGGEDGDGERPRSIAGLRRRIDGFTPERQRTFLKWLGRTGCLKDAARKAGVSTTTIDRTRRKFADFDSKCVAARELALPGLEAIAYRRATVGAPEKVIRKGKVVQIKVKPSDSMLRLLLTGAAPRKYGRYAGRRQTGRDAARRRRDKLPKAAPVEQVTESIDKKLDVLRRRQMKRGYSEGPEGMLVPPGWRMVREEELQRLGWTPPETGPAAEPAALPAPEGGED